MKPLVPVVLALVITCGCGGRPRATGFENHTQLTEAQLMQAWQDAQRAVAAGIAINAITVQTQPGVLPEIVNDARAGKVAPGGTVLTAVPDIPGQPGFIPCDGCGRCVGAYTVPGTPEAVFVSQWRLEHPTFWEPMLEYEFENVILSRLGYNLTER